MGNKQTENNPQCTCGKMRLCILHDGIDAAPSIFFASDKDTSPYRDCSSCQGRCLWTDDAWVCTVCGDEWYPEHGNQYSPPTDAKRQS